MRHHRDSQTLVRASLEAGEWLESFLSNGNLDDAASANILTTLTFLLFQIKGDYSQFDQGESPVTDAIR